MTKFELTSRPHPARRARRAVGVSSVAATVGIAGAIAVSQQESSAEASVVAGGVDAPTDTSSTSVLDTTSATPAAIAAPILPESTLPQRTVPTTTTTTPPGDNPFSENGALSDLTGLVVTTTTTTTTTAAPRPRATAPPATTPTATNPPATQPPAPPTTVSNGS